jgi:hypothetical protein
MNHIDSMTPRQLVVALMRGDRANFQMGYSPESATLAACERHDIDPESSEAKELHVYAKGWHDGANEPDIENLNLTTRISEAIGVG